MEFSTVMLILGCVSIFRLGTNYAVALIVRVALDKFYEDKFRQLNKYMVRKALYKIVMSMCYVIVYNVVSSLNYPVWQSLSLMGMLGLVELTVFAYYDRPSYGYAQLKQLLGALRWVIV